MRASRNIGGGLDEITVSSPDVPRSPVSGEPSVLSAVTCARFNGTVPDWLVTVRHRVATCWVTDTDCPAHAWRLTRSCVEESVCTVPLQMFDRLGLMLALATDPAGTFTRN